MGETGLSKLIEPVVQELGCELWGIEKLQQGRQVVLKIYLELMLMTVPASVAR